MDSNSIQPIFVLPEGTLRNSGKGAQRNNIAAAKMISNTIRTTLGPKGMDKMLVDKMGDIIITNDGVTILEEMDIEHPAAKMMVEIAKVQEEEVGDGTTTAVVIGGELLGQAEKLLDMNIHPTVIAEGYKIAAKKSYEFLNEISREIDIMDKDTLKNVAITAMTGKNVEWAKDNLAKIAVEAVMTIQENGEIDADNIKLEKKEGGSSADTELVSGLIIDKEKVHPDMPKKVDNAKIALIESAIEIKESEIDTKININDPKQLQAFLEQEEKTIKEMVDVIVKSGANVVFCQKGIDDTAQYLLSKKKIFALRRVTQEDMIRISKATGAKIVSNIKELSKEDLGKAGLIHEKKFGDSTNVFIEKCSNPKAVSIIVRGGTRHVVDEVERALQDAIDDLVSAIKNKRCIAGGGAVEIELSKKIREFSETLTGKEQLAVKVFADVLEMIPRTLAENAGLDPIDVLTELKSVHEKGKYTYGIDVFSGKTKDMWKEGIIEPLKIKTQAIMSATEAANLILRIDDVIYSGKSNQMQNVPGNNQMPY